MVVGFSHVNVTKNEAEILRYWMLKQNVLFDGKFGFRQDFSFQNHIQANLIITLSLGYIETDRVLMGLFTIEL